MSVSQFVDRAFVSGTAGRLAEAAQLLTQKTYAAPDTLVMLSLDPTLIPGGAAILTLSPLLRGGYIDGIVTTGDNLYYDILYALGTRFYRQEAGAGHLDETEACGRDLRVRKVDVARVEDVLREVLALPDFQRPMGSAALHDLLGSHLRAREKALGVEYPSLLTTAHEAGVPIYNPTSAGNPFGSILSDLALVGNRLTVDASIDLNAAAAVFNGATSANSACAAVCLGSGAAARFLLTVPHHLETILPVRRGVRYETCLRIQDGLAERASEHREDQGREKGSLSLTANLTLALPLLTAYILDRVPARPPKRLGPRRDELLDRLRQDRLQATLKRP
jgi:deoxyhypusine synthase